MTEEFYLKVGALISHARHEHLKTWLQCWTIRPDGADSLELCLFWAKELERLNDVDLEMRETYALERGWKRP